ncbi:MAG: lipopolysaccharide transport periplasmic protein LptA [Deltaproteobacteria bacterium]|nr:lipopolysaccharide transport periplasmic protein LptA [Deltaproteobacteria bacterium]
MYRKFLILFPFFFIFLVQKSIAFDTGFSLDLKKSDQPIAISSDRMEYNNKNHNILFSGNVIIKQGDLKIQAKELKVMQDEQGKNITSIIAKGDVQIQQKESIASCDEAKFFMKKEMVILTGHPIIRQGENIVEGEKITILFAEKRSIVEGGANQRVEVTLSPPKKGKEKKE